MPHYFHQIADGAVQLYDVGETLLDRQLEMLDELLNQGNISGNLQRAALKAKDALAILRFQTQAPDRKHGPCRESVESAPPIAVRSDQSPGS